MSDVYAEYREKYAKLKAEAAARKEKANEFQADIDAVNAQIEELRVVQAELVEKRSAALGGQSYLDLKKHIAALAKLLQGK